MSWQTITAADVLTELTPDEAATIAAQQAADNLPAVLARVVAEARGAIRNGGYALDADATKLPLELHSDVIAIARWRWLISLPQCKTLETDVRERAFKAGLAKFARIAQQQDSVEPPSGVVPSQNQSGNWNSENRILGRMHPVPRPGLQFPSSLNDNANPNAPADTSAA